MPKSSWFGFALSLACWITLSPACSSTSSNEATTGGAGGSGGGASDCCTARAEPGCSDKTLQACVCNVNATCCSGTWNGFCVTAAQINCSACGAAGSGGAGGFGGEPFGGAGGFGGEPFGGAGGFGGGPNGGSGGVTSCPPVSSQVPAACASVTLPLPADCCTAGASACSDPPAHLCLGELDSNCLTDWNDCCVSLAEKRGYCPVAGDAGSTDSSSGETGAADGSSGSGGAIVDSGGTLDGGGV